MTWAWTIPGHYGIHPIIPLILRPRNFRIRFFFIIFIFFYFRIYKYFFSIRFEYIFTTYENSHIVLCECCAQTVEHVSFRLKTMAAGLALSPEQSNAQFPCLLSAILAGRRASVGIAKDTRVGIYYVYSRYKTLVVCRFILILTAGARVEFQWRLKLLYGSIDWCLMRIIWL